MFDTRPYALIVDRDDESRARITSSLRESGFVAAAFRDECGALPALAARSVDIAIIAGHAAEGEDALAIARRMRDCRLAGKVLFAGPADALPAAPGADSGLAVTRPFDKRRLLSAVFELLARDGNADQRRAEAERGLMAARLACLRSRPAGAGKWTAAPDIAHQLGDAVAARLAKVGLPGAV